MTRSLAAPRSSARVAAAVLAASLAGALTSSAFAALPSGSPVRAIVSYDGRLAPVPGVQVVSSLRRLHMAVVRTDSAGLHRLTTVPGVRGVSLDDAVQLSGHDESGSDEGFLASQGLGGRAGKAGAGAGIRVAVIDTGVSDTPALNRASGRLVDGADSSQVVDGQYGQAQTGGVYTDGYGHGTFMADLIAGGPVAGSNGKAIGVAPAATVVVIRVARADGTSSLSKVLAGLDWLASNASSVDVANLSLSHVRPKTSYGADPLTDAVETIRMSGIDIVVASGNDKKTVSDPGFDPHVITVGAADLGTERVADFSGRDTVNGVVKPDVVANGVHVLGLLPQGSVLEQAASTTHLADGLFRGSGTSQATAVTSGVVALFLAAHPNATTAQVKGSLRCSATPLKGKGDGAGLVHLTGEVCADSDGRALDGGGDATGESSFDASSWGASSWGASSWGASSWGASSWGASSWGASSWGASSWGASSWGASSWGASSWGADSWGDGG